MIKRGGVLVGHGYTHQWDGGVNPYDGATGDDVEFFRVVENKSRLVYRGLSSEDSLDWADRRLAYANREFIAAGIPAPQYLRIPALHCVAEASYRAAARRYATRWERSIYFPGRT